MYNAPLNGGCGVTNLFSFYKDSYKDFKLPPSGARLYIAMFKDTPGCFKAYEFLSQKMKIGYQSSVRKNKRSGNKVFFVVFERK